MIICADDYGISPAVSAGILELIEKNRITATSCMMIGPNVEVAMECLRSAGKGIEIGLHLVLTNDRPLTSIKPGSGLVDFQGNLLSFSSLLANAYKRAIDYNSVLGEIRAQTMRFIELMGRDPDYFDGHQHVQQLPIVRKAVATVVKSRARNQNIYVRVAGLPLNWYWTTGSTYSISLAIGNILIALPGKPTRQLISKYGIPHNRFLLGYYNYESADKFEKIFQHYLKAKPAEKDILFCHPGHVDDELIRRDSVTNSREDTFKFLSSPLCLEIMEKAGVGLNTFF